MENYPNKNIRLSCKNDFDTIEVSYNHPSGSVWIGFNIKGEKRHSVEIHIAQVLQLRDCLDVVEKELVKYGKIKSDYSPNLSLLSQLRDQVRDQVSKY